MNHPDGVHFIFQDEPLANTNDYGRINGPGLVVVAPGCHLVQIAAFTPDAKIPTKGTLRVNSKLFERLDWLNKGLLFVHEQVYSLERYNALSLVNWNSKR